MTDLRVLPAQLTLLSTGQELWRRIYVTTMIERGSGHTAVEIDAQISDDQLYGSEWISYTGLSNEGGRYSWNYHMLWIEEDLLI